MWYVPFQKIQDGGVEPASLFFLLEWRGLGPRGRWDVLFLRQTMIGMHRSIHVCVALRSRRGQIIALLRPKPRPKTPKGSVLVSGNPRLFQEKSRLVKYYNLARFVCTPLRINGWNLQITQFKEKIIWTTFPFWGSMLIFQGVYIVYDFFFCWSFFFFRGIGLKYL